MTCSCIRNSTPLHTIASATSGSAARYRLTPHARITVSSLERVSPPIVASTATSVAVGMTYAMNCGVE